MNILIVAATLPEILPTLNTLQWVDNNDNLPIEIKYKNHQLTFVITGVGMVAMAYQTTKALSNKKYDLAINAGICGSFNAAIKIGDVVGILSDTYSEMGAEDGDSFLSLEELGLPGDTHFTYSELLVRNRILNDLQMVTAITVNTTHGNDESIAKVVAKCNPMVETMEGAAFMQVCKNEKIPYYQLRCVSNFVTRRNRESWNIPLAVEKLNHTLLEVFTAF